MVGKRKLEDFHFPHPSWPFLRNAPFISLLPLIDGSTRSSCTLVLDASISPNEYVIDIVLTCRIEKDGAGSPSFRVAPGLQVRGICSAV